MSIATIFTGFIPTVYPKKFGRHARQKHVIFDDFPLFPRSSHGVSTMAWLVETQGLEDVGTDRNHRHHHLTEILIFLSVPEQAEPRTGDGRVE